MQVLFYIISKKQNSTKQPDDSTADEWTCNLKENCSQLYPVIRLQYSITTRPNYNYCKIAKFNRYYFIKDWTFTLGGVWEASCTVDVLASWRANIGTQRLYVTRSASDYDLFAVDNTYKAKYDCTSSTTEAPQDIYIDVEGQKRTLVEHAFYMPRSLGWYYVKIIDYTGDGIKLYVMNQFNFNSLVGCLSDIDYQGDFEESELGVARGLANPIQFINNIYWLPYCNPDTVFNRQTLHLGYYELPIEINCAEVVATSFSAEFDINVPDHPQSSRGWYVNQEPYTKLFFKFEPFGNYEIPASSLAHSTAMSVRWTIDSWTGKAILNVYAKQTGTLLIKDSCDYGVPIELAQVTTSVKSGIWQQAVAGGQMLATDIASSLGILPEGTQAETMASLFNKSAIGQGLLNSGISVNKTGASGSFTPFIITPTINATFMILVDENLEHAGRPLCQVKQINTLTGFIQCAEGDIDLPCYEEERGMISSYLTNGFFYE